MKKDTTTRRDVKNVRVQTKNKRVLTPTKIERLKKVGATK
jgi:hypothetical protein